LNNIKEFRYELWCLGYCVAYCDVEDNDCRKWNRERREKGEYNYDNAIFEDLVRRFEKPERRNQRDSPLFELKSSSSSSDSASVADDTVSYITKEVNSKTRDVKILQPTIATQTWRFRMQILYMSWIKQHKRLLML